jgi:hypothetical protein
MIIDQSVHCIKTSRKDKRFLPAVQRMGESLGEILESLADALTEWQLFKGSKTNRRLHNRHRINALVYVYSDVEVVYLLGSHYSLILAIRTIGLHGQVRKIARGRNPQNTYSVAILSLSLTARLSIDIICHSVARHLHLRSPNELSDLIILRHEIGRGVEILIPFPVPPLLAHELLEPAHSQLTILHRPRELLPKIRRSNKRAQHSIRLRRHEKHSTPHSACGHLACDALCGAQQPHPHQ